MAKVQFPMREFSKKIDEVLRAHRFEREPLKSALIRREIAAAIRQAAKECIAK